MRGLLVSSLSPREDQALLIVIGVVVLHLVFSGGIVPIDKLGPAGVVADGAATKWGFQGLTAAAGLTDNQCSGAQLAECRLPGLGKYEHDAERALVLEPIREHYAGVFGANLYGCWAAIGGIIVACFAGLYLRQRFRH